MLGKDPIHYDPTGIDLHMVQSIEPRPGIPGDPASPRGDNGSDSIVGRDWRTGKRDLQYACTFPLKNPRNCDDVNAVDSCDSTAQNNTAGQNQPLCQAGTANVQTRAKAYPTIRELEVARALGAQGITASLCPLNPTLSNTEGANKTDPEYGYNPAVASIIDRLKNALTQQCLPQSLHDLPDGGTTDPDLLKVPCLILAQLAPDGNQDCVANGLTETDAEVVKVFLEQQLTEAGKSAAGTALAHRKVCTVPQLVEPPGQSCRTEPAKRRCYVENAGGSDARPAGRCQQAIVFSAGTQDLSAARLSLQCIRQFPTGGAAGD